MEYDFNSDNNRDFLQAKLIKKRRSEELVEKEKKLGPRDLGTMHGWRGMNYDVEKEEEEKRKKKKKKSV